LNRIATASSSTTSGPDCWGQSFGYDRYGNLTTVNVTQCSAPTLSLAVNNNNWIINTGFSILRNIDILVNPAQTARGTPFG
jgi:hypothetical protein